MSAFDGVGDPSWQAMEAAVGQSGIPVPPFSAVRPGGYHGTGNAVDFSDGGDAGTPAMDRLAGWIAGSYGPVSLEIIHVNQDGSTVEWKDGQPKAHGWYGLETLTQHRNHVHWAITNTGLQGKTAGGAGGLLGSIGGAVSQTGAAFAALNAVAGHLTDTAWWRRIMIGAIGLLVGVIAVTIVKRGLAA